MKIFNWLFSRHQDADFGTTHSGTDINPASGLPMVGGIGNVDVAGNPFGTNMTNGHDFSGSSFDGGGGFSGGCDGGFGGGFGHGHDW